MVIYSDLNETEKRIFNKVEKIFLEDKSINRAEWVRVLGLMINKYKLKG
jgi:hypothetical protein